MSYPKWLFHKTLEAKIVQDEAEHKSIGVDWLEAPIEVSNESKSDEAKHSEDKKQDETPQEQTSGKAEVDIGKLNKSELIEVAIEKGIEPTGLTKAQLIEQIRGV